MNIPITPRKLAGTVLAVGLASSAVLVGSYANWTATTSNPGNSVSAATFNLTNSKDTASVFTAATNAKPGDGSSSTVVIKNNNPVSGLPMTVKLSQTNVSSNALAGQLKLSIHDDTTNTCVWPVETFGAGACSTTAAWDGSATLTNLGVKTIAGTNADWPAQETHTFTVAWSFPSAVTATTGQGQTASFDLGWTGTQL